MKNCCDHPRQRLVSIIHHFVCSEQNLQFRFEQGVILVCPKCKVDLTFEIEGYHYDFPGMVMYCENCGLACSPSD